MTPHDEQHEDALPEWLERALAKADPISEADWARFEYMKHDFFELLDRAAPYRVRKTTHKEAARAVFSLAGQLLHAAQDALVIDTGPDPAPVTRSVNREPPTEPARGNKSVVKFPAENVEIEVVHTEQNKTTVLLSVNLRERGSGKEIRPLRIRIRDSEGDELVEPQYVGKTDLPPSFPNPHPGDYVIEVEWAEGCVSAEVRYENQLESTD